MQTPFVAQDKKYDARDIDYRKLGTARVLPEEYEVPWMKDMVLHQQGDTPYCGAHSGAHAKQSLDFKDTGKQSYSPEYLWKKIKTLDGYPPEVGTDIRSICKALKNWGICDLDVLPNNVNAKIEDYTRDDTTVDQNMNAQPRIIGSYGFMGNDRELIKAAIYDTGAALLLIRFDNKDYFSKEVVTTNGKQSLGHFVWAYGWTKDNSLKVRCSASSKYPDKLLAPSFVIRDSATLTDIPDNEVRQLIKQRELLQKLVELWRKFIGLTKK